MSRLSYPDQNQVPAEVQEYLAQLPQDAVIRTLSYSPETVKAFVALGQKMYTSLTLPERVRELAILAVATTSRCEYVFAQHESFAERAGLNREERDAIRRGDHTHFFESDRTILDFASAVAAGPEVDDRTFTAARTILGDRHIVEMLELCGYYLAFGRICTVLQLEIEVHGAGVLDQIKAMKDS